MMRRVKTQLQAMLEPNSGEPVARPPGSSIGELVP